jgi:hypothetical protein
MTITARQIGPLKQYRNLWRTDEVAGYLAVYLEDGNTVSDLMTVGMDTSCGGTMIIEPLDAANGDARIVRHTTCRSWWS